MSKKDKLSKGEKRDLEKKIEVLKASPGDAMAASRVGYLLRKAERDKEASSYLWTAFRSFISAGQYSMAVMVADELLSIQNYCDCSAFHIREPLPLRFVSNLLECHQLAVESGYEVIYQSHFVP